MCVLWGYQGVSVAVMDGCIVFSLSLLYGLLTLSFRNYISGLLFLASSRSEVLKFAKSSSVCRLHCVPHNSHACRNNVNSTCTYKDFVWVGNRMWKDNERERESCCCVVCDAGCVLPDNGGAVCLCGGSGSHQQSLRAGSTQEEGVWWLQKSESFKMVKTCYQHLCILRGCVMSSECWNSAKFNNDILFRNILKIQRQFFVNLVWKRSHRICCLSNLTHRYADHTFYWFLIAGSSPSGEVYDEGSCRDLLPLSSHPWGPQPPEGTGGTYTQYIGVRNGVCITKVVVKNYYCAS